MTTLHQLFVRVHARYTPSPYVEDLAGFARWLREREYPVRYAQRLVFWTMRALEAYGRPPGCRWTSAELDRAFHRRRQRCKYHYARRRFGEFLQLLGRLTPLRETGPPGASSSISSRPIRGWHCR